jgi:hypothetical protein
MSGFGSETVLLMIRGFFTGIKPQSVTPVATKSGSIGGVVTDATAKPVADATVSLVSDPTKKAKTDAQGAYLLEGVPAGDQRIQVDRAGPPAVRKVVDVKVEGDKKAVYNVTLP